MTKKQRQDRVAIAGAGPAGLTLAALLAVRGITSVVIDRTHPRDLAAPGHDTRTTALSYGTMQLLKPLGFWDALEAKAAPIRSIAIRDGRAPLLLDFGAAVAAEVTGRADDTPMGWIVDNGDLRAALWQAVVAYKDMCHIVAPAGVTDFMAEPDAIRINLTNGETIQAPLLIGADGRLSTVRALAGLDVVAIDYRQIATVGLIRHTAPHHGRALEHFYNDGPFAVLPFTDDPKTRQSRSAVVWTRSLNARQRRLVKQRDFSELALPNDLLQIELQRRIGNAYGDVTPVGTWDHYPLSLAHATGMIADRVALVGDAAHAIHPIAGQGLNVGMQDIGCLVGLLGRQNDAGRDVGTAELLQEYQAKRRFSVMTMVAATDGLNRLFGLDSTPLKFIRTLGLGVVQAAPPLKRFFVKRAMGL